MLYNRFTDGIRKNCFINKGDTVLVAVSGGADSVCLFHLLLRYREEFPFRLYCAHVNHMLRKEAYDDVAFVESFCKSNSVPFYLYERNVKEAAEQNKESIELTGRNIRYNFFNSIECDVIMTAHNKNDVAESMLLHFTRGTGLDGLCGIPSRRNDKICRPLLPFSRKEIMQYLAMHNLSWREDQSNLDVIYTRNKIRHKIIPILEEINPSFLDAAFRTAEILSDENCFISDNIPYDSVVETSQDAVRISVCGLKRLPIALQRRIVFSLSENYSDVSLVLSLIDAQNGTCVSLSHNKEATKEYDFISIYEKKEKQLLHEISLPENGSVLFGDYLITVGEGEWSFPKGAYTVRTRQDGDYFYPEGMNGRKKIKDLLIDMKIPKRLRDKLPLLVSNGEIAAVANLRKSKNFVVNNTHYINIKIEPITGA